MTPIPPTTASDTTTSTSTAAGFSRRSFLGGGATAVALAGAAAVATAEPAAADVSAEVAADAGRGGGADVLADLPRANKIPRRRRVVDYELAEMIVLLRAGRLTSTEITRAYLERIDALNGPFEVYDDNGGYNAFVRIDREGALAAASEADDRFRRARSKHDRDALPILLGIPFGIKDSIGVQGLEARNGTHAYDGNVALRDSTIVAKLRAAGAVILGQTIASAFSGSIAGTFAGNAWDPERVPGGSSQGSGVAPVARLAAAAIGEETGGSIIMPSSANGASGIKPSLGLSSTAGVMPLSPGYDVVGPIARSVRDAAIILSVMHGPDPANDPLTLAAPVPFDAIPVAPRRGRRPLAGLRIGVPQTDWMSGGGTGVAPADTYDADYGAAFERFKNQLRALGAQVVDFDGLDVTVAENDPYFRTAERLPLPDGTVVSPASAVLSPNRYEIGYWEAVKRFAADHPEQEATLRRQFGDFDAQTAAAGSVTAAVRAEGERRRRTLQANFAAALDAAGIDFMLVLPIGAHVGPRFGGSQLPNYRSFYQLPNALTWPMVTFPIGYGSSVRLPVNAAFWGRRFSEPGLIQAALDFQAAYPEYHEAAPPDPTFAAPRARRKAADEPVAPELSNDPLVAEQAWA
ncbi:amidase [Isoptericola sp. F-RaC21]|uniref:amidase n=1 Tax=Isoptericola sp. F-RaC21 TaxID=3141452 RepID=UPI00315B6E52